MTSAIRWIWAACGVALAVVVALAATLVARQPAAGAPSPAPAEPFALGAPVTVPVGKGPLAVAATPDGRRVLVLAQPGMVVLDAGTNAVLGTITLSIGVGDMVLAPDGARAYLRSPDGIEPVDLTTGLVADPVVGEGADVAYDLGAVSPDGTRLSGVIYGQPYAVGLVDLAAGTARRVPLPPGAGPDGAVVTPDGSRAYVVVRSLTSGGISDPLQVVDVATGAASPVPGTEGTLAVALSPDGRSLYATGYSNVVVLDAATGAVTRTVPASLLSGQFVVSPSGRHLYVANATGNAVEVFDMDEGSVVERVPVGALPTDIALAPDGTRLYVVSEAGLTVVPVTGGT